MRLVCLLILLVPSLLCGDAVSFVFASEPSGTLTVRGPRQGDYPNVMSFKALAGDAVSVSATDPNYEEDSPLPYTGVPLQRILNRAGVTGMTGVTLIGRDQYAVYLPAALAANPKVIIAAERAGQPLARYFGGPLKLMFPLELKMHPSAYCWYVETLIPDYVENPFVTVKVNGKASQYTPADLDALGPSHKSLYLSIPLGYRWDFPKIAQPSRVTAIPLGALFDGKDAGAKRLTLTPFSGRPVTLPVAPLLSCEVLLVYRINDEPIHPALGGPFSVYFPVMACGELEGIAPETASLFFLSEISID